MQLLANLFMFNALKPADRLLIPVQSWHRQYEVITSVVFRVMSGKQRHTKLKIPVLYNKYNTGINISVLITITIV